MAASDEVITCIYCRQQRPSSREHILAKSLGGNAVAPITCVSCNTTILSSLDQAIAEHSLVALARVAFTPSDAFDVRLGGEHFHYDEGRDLHAEVTLINGFKPHTFPQIHFRYGSNEVVALASDFDDLKSLIRLLETRTQNSTIRNMHVKHGPPEYCSTARIVSHRSKDVFLRVRKPNDESQIFEFLDLHWKELRERILSGQFTNRTHVQPTIQVRLSITLDDVYRAVAKTAFNVLASDIGVEFALRPEFDSLREYILGRDIRHQVPLEPDEVAVDERFVQMLSSDDDPAILRTDGHVVTLFHPNGELMAMVTLYSRHSFLVAMGPIPLPQAAFAIHEFSIDRVTNRRLDVDEAYRRIVEKRGSL